MPDILQGHTNMFLFLLSFKDEWGRLDDIDKCIWEIICYGIISVFVRDLKEKDNGQYNLMYIPNNDTLNYPCCVLKLFGAESPNQDFFKKFWSQRVREHLFILKLKIWITTELLFLNFN